MHFTTTCLLNQSLTLTVRIGTSHPVGECCLVLMAFSFALTFPTLMVATTMRQAILVGHFAREGGIVRSLTWAATVGPLVGRLLTAEAGLHLLQDLEHFCHLSSSANSICRLCGWG